MKYAFGGTRYDCFPPNIYSYLRKIIKCGILSRSDIVGICPVGFCLWGFCPVGFCPVGFCLDTESFRGLRLMWVGTTVVTIIKLWNRPFYKDCNWLIGERANPLCQPGSPPFLWIRPDSQCCWSRHDLDQWFSTGGHMAPQGGIYKSWGGIQIIWGIGEEWTPSGGINK